MAKKQVRVCSLDFNANHLITRLLNIDWNEHVSIVDRLVSQSAVVELLIEMRWRMTRPLDRY